jgi:hypothetical protein
MSRKQSTNSRWRSDQIELRRVLPRPFGRDSPRTMRPDVSILTVAMPLMNGMRQRVKSLGEVSSIRVLI